MNTAKPFVPYYRVSTTKQEYGLEAQQTAVLDYIKQTGGTMVAEYQEKETGKMNERPQLRLAIEHAKKAKATLVIAKLDRLSRRASFLMSLQDSNLDFVALDCRGMDKFSIGLLALLAQREVDILSQRTKAGLAVAKASGVVLGCPNPRKGWNVAAQAIQARKQAFNTTALNSIREIQSTGIQSLNRISDCLNKRGEKTAMGKAWNAQAVKRVLASEIPVQPTIQP